MVAKRSLLLNSYAQFIVLCRHPSGDIGFINIYATNNLIEQSHLWEVFMVALPYNFQLIIAGDFNFVESK